MPVDNRPERSHLWVDKHGVVCGQHVGARGHIMQDKPTLPVCKRSQLLAGTVCQQQLCDGAWLECHNVEPINCRSTHTHTMHTYVKTGQED